MKLSISNIAWSSEYDLEMYDFLKEHAYLGLEIAPTRILPDSPYQRLSEAKQFKSFLETNYNLKISSIQSICFGKNEPGASFSVTKGTFPPNISKACQ